LVIRGWRGDSSSCKERVGVRFCDLVYLLLDCTRHEGTGSGFKNLTYGHFCNFIFSLKVQEDIMKVEEDIMEVQEECVQTYLKNDTWLLLSTPPQFKHALSQFFKMTILLLLKVTYGLHVLKIFLK